MIRQSDCDECRDNRAGAQAPPPAPPLERVRVYKSVGSRAAKTENVTVLELVLAANPLSIEKRAACRLEIGHIVTAARVSDGRMTIGYARICNSQSRPFRTADRRFIPPKQQQPRARRLAIHRQQTCSLRPSQHWRLLPCGSRNPAAI